MRYIIFGLFCLMIGCPVFCVGLNFYKKDKKHRKKYTSKSVGKVVDFFENEESPEGETKTIFYYPIFAYKVKGNEIVKKSKYGHSIKPYKIGQKVKIYYNPNNCSDFYVEDELLETIIYLCMIVFSIIAIIFGIAMIFVGSYK